MLSIIIANKFNTSILFFDEIIPHSTMSVLIKSNFRGSLEMDTADAHNEECV